MVVLGEHIMHWLWNNKEWLFSGCGIAVLGLFYKAIVRRRSAAVTPSPANSFNNSHIANPPARMPSELPYSPRPTPDEIENQLASLPIFQRRTAKDSYVGLRVRWPVALFGLTELADSERRIFQTDATHCLQAKFAASPGCIVWANVNVNSFPRLKISHTDEPLQIWGTISNVSDSGAVRLRDASVEFDEPPDVGVADYRIERDGTTITFASERAVNRVSGPKPKQGWRLALRSKYEASQFVDAGESEGFSFDGKEFL